MVTWRLEWIPSPDTFVDKLAVFASINGQPAAQLGADLFASATSYDHQFNEGDTVDAWVVAYGDNGTQAPSAHVSFTAVNEQQVRPVTGLSAKFVSYNP